jgi:hypothetical protein
LIHGNLLDIAMRLAAACRRDFPIAEFAALKGSHGAASWPSAFAA